jgi:hypothetical protein
MTEAINSSERLVHIYQATRFHITEDRDTQFDSHNILKPRITTDRRLSKTQMRLALNSGAVERHLQMASGLKVLAGGQ